MTTLRTARLELRPWHDDDLEAFVGMNADPRVMEFFPALMTRAETIATTERLRLQFATHGYGFWSVGRLGGGADERFLGFVGLGHPRYQAPFATDGPTVEVGWRLRPEGWGKGYATEAAEASLAFGFGPAGLRELVSMTVPPNVRSRRVMEKLGFVHDVGGDFDHPLVPVDSPMRRHVLYRLTRPAWAARRATIGPAAPDVVRPLIEEYPRAIGVDLTYQGFPEELAGLPGAYAAPRGCLLVATAPDGAALGCVAVRPIGEDTAELKRLYVRPEGRGAGLARRLSEAAIAHARAAGYARLRLDTLEIMTPAIALYRSLGFVRIAPYGGPALPGTAFFELALC